MGIARVRVRGRVAPAVYALPCREAKARRFSVHILGAGSLYELLNQCHSWSHEGIHTSRATKSCNGPFLTLQAQEKHNTNVEPLYKLSIMACRPWVLITNSPKLQSKRSSKRKRAPGWTCLWWPHPCLVIFFKFLLSHFDSQDLVDSVFTWWQQCLQQQRGNGYPRGNNGRSSSNRRKQEKQWC